MTPMFQIIQPSENVAIGGGSLQSAAAPVGTTHVRLACTGACHVIFNSANPTALATSLLLSSTNPEVYPIGAGQKVAVLQDAAVTGNLNVTFLRLQRL